VLGFKLARVAEDALGRGVAVDDGGHLCSQFGDVRAVARVARDERVLRVELEVELGAELALGREGAVFVHVDGVAQVPALASGGPDSVCGGGGGAGGVRGGL